MMIAMLSICSKEELSEDGKIDDGMILFFVIFKILKPVDRWFATKLKLLVKWPKYLECSGKSRFFIFREEKETIAELKNVLGVTVLPAGTLALGSEGIKQGN